MAVAENLAGGANRVAQALDAADAAAAEGRAVHDESVELHFAVAVQETAASGVESFVVFENDDGFFDRVESRAAAFQHAPSGGGGIAHTVEVRLDHVIGNGPGAAVNDQNGIGWHFQSLREVAGDSLALRKSGPQFSAPTLDLFCPRAVRICPALSIGEHGYIAEPPHFYDIRNKFAKIVFRFCR